MSSSAPLAQSSTPPIEYENNIGRNLEKNDSGETSSAECPVVVIDETLLLEAEQSIISISSDDEESETAASALPSNETIDLTSPNDVEIRVATSSRRHRRRKARQSDDDVLISVSTRNRNPAASKASNQGEAEVIVIQKENINDPSRSKVIGEDNDPYTPKRKALSCPVCMDHERTIRRTGRQLMSTTCGHIFCNECITQSITTIKCCPTCRKKINKKTGIHPIFV